MSKQENPKDTIIEGLVIGAGLAFMVMIVAGALGGMTALYLAYAGIAILTVIYDVSKKQFRVSAGALAIPVFGCVVLVVLYIVYSILGLIFLGGLPR